MKPFDLKAALAGAPVVTRDGRKVTNVTQFPVGEQPVAAVVEGSDEIDTFTEEGVFNPFVRVSTSKDLFMASTTKTGWVAYGPDVAYDCPSVFGYSTHVWSTEEEAIDAYKAANVNRLPTGTQKLTWEE